MTIPQYDLLTRRKLPAVFPPVLDAENVPTQFELTYVGTKLLRQRVFRALLRYAAGQIGFWQFSIAIVLIGSLGVALSARGMPVWYVVVLGSIVFVGALVMPLRLTVGVRNAADSYALEGKTYSTKFDQTSIVWRTPSDTYEVPWELVDKAISKGDVTILTLKSSRAICVLPSELLDSASRARLVDIDQRRRELS